MNYYAHYKLRLKKIPQRLNRCYIQTSIILEQILMFEILEKDVFKFQKLVSIATYLN